MEKDAERLCNLIYSETKAFYETIADRCENQGFQILLGPPFVEAPILFIGYQPGRGLKSPEEERQYGSEDRWPSRCEYVTEDWALARNMRLMFPQELLERCVGLNAIFVRSPNAQHYRSRVEAKLRREIEVFCLVSIGRILAALRPKLVVIFGFETLALFGESTPVLRSGKSGRVLARTARVAGRQAVGTLHLSGAHISRQDRETIAGYILAVLDS
ncbi:MAG TPA: hypothetical protein VJN92_14265 [Candidatus Acidoferrum sp.]|nr:hypothetical protein [Candidatus Acidoferrum sp.]